MQVTLQASRLVHSGSYLGPCGHTQPWLQATQLSCLPSVAQQAPRTSPCPGRRGLALHTRTRFHTQLPQALCPASPKTATSDDWPRETQAASGWGKEHGECSLHCMSC